MEICADLRLQKLMFFIIYMNISVCYIKTEMTVFPCAAASITVLEKKSKTVIDRLSYRQTLAAKLEEKPTLIPQIFNKLAFL